MTVMVSARNTEPKTLTEFAGSWHHATGAIGSNNMPLHVLFLLTPKQRNTAQHKQEANSTEQHVTDRTSARRHTMLFAVLLPRGLPDHVAPPYVPTVPASRSTLKLTNVPTVIAVSLHALVTLPSSLHAVTDLVHVPDRTYIRHHPMLLAMLFPTDHATEHSSTMHGTKRFAVLLTRVSPGHVALRHVPIVLASRSTVIQPYISTTVTVALYAQVTQPRSFPAHTMLLGMLAPGGLSELPVGGPLLATPSQAPTAPASRSTLTLADGSVALFDISSHAPKLLPDSTTALLISAGATAGLVIRTSFWSRWARKDEFSSQMRGISRRSVRGPFPVLGLALRLPGQRIL